MIKACSQAVVLRAELRGLEGSMRGGEEGPARAVLARLHELVVRFDREVGDAVVDTGCLIYIYIYI
jgi:hypothetical protein